MAATTLHTTDAFVLRTYDYAEAHRIIVLFTRVDGLIRAVAPGARSTRRKYGAAFELLSEVTVAYREREGRELAQLTAWEVKQTRFAAAADPSTVALLGYWAELVSELFPPHQANDPVYRLLAAGCEAVERQLAHGRGDVWRAQPLLNAYVETWLLRLAGFLPDWRRCALCGTRFDHDSVARLTGDGTPACRRCLSVGRLIRPPAHRAYIAIQRLAPNAFLDAFLVQPVEETGLDDLTEANRRLLERVIERPLKSYAVWQRLRLEPPE